MVKVTPKTKKYVLIAVIALASIALVSILALTIFRAFKNDDIRLEGYKEAARVEALSNAKEKCMEEGLDDGVCNNLETESGSVTDSLGQTGWIVYVKSEDGYIYNASFIVVREGGTSNYRATNYLRNRVQKP